VFLNLKDSADFYVAWAWVPGDVAGNDGTGWGSQGGYTFLPAFRVRGTSA